MDTNAAHLTRLSEEEARAMIEAVRWPQGPGCVHCGSVNVVKLGGAAGVKGLIKCRDCRQKFTVRVGTIFEDSPIPLRDWVYAFARMCASKKGISAHQLHREIGVTYKTAWFMCHRIRLAMRDDGTFQLTGTVEVDEAYCGGKPRKLTGPHKRGRGTSKQPIQTLVERGGRKRTRVICDVTASTLKATIREHVHQSAAIMTDENSSYKGIGGEYAGGHGVVTHAVHQYVGPNGESTNTAESSFALIKRGLYGTFHHVSKKHLQRYCDEFDFRWDHRKINDMARTMEAIKQIEGKRLLYRQPG
ncbi:MAG: IS1595 family transposase [Planctomycetia bacterium]|nr:IS1595 family transposase [Planctomycetia bacterium]